MNPLGICSWTFGVDDTPAALMAKVRALGLDGLQYSGDVRRMDPLAVGRCAVDDGLALFAIDPIDVAPPPGNVATERGAIDYYRQVIDFAAASGARAATLHGLAKWTENCPGKEAAWERLASCLDALAGHARSCSIEPLFEICNRYELSQIHTVAEYAALSERMGQPPCRLLLDSFHMNIEEPDPCAALRGSQDRLAIYHVSDSNRGGIGAGHIDFAAQHAVLEGMGFDGPVMFEIVLPHRAPSTPPRDAADWRALERALHDSIAAWRSMDEATAVLRQSVPTSTTPEESTH